MSQSEEKAASNSVGKENARLTWEGCSVLLDINDSDRLVFARLSAASELKIGNKNCSLQPLIGCPFGSAFQVDNGPNGSYLSRLIPSSSTQHQVSSLEERTEPLVDVESRDNRALIDNNKAQSLTGEDIAAMREQGARGDEIIEALIANSTTFEKKTQFSQEKYRLRKQKKYAPKVLIRRPFSRSICEAYFKKYPFKIGFLRMDALSLLLSMANASANSDILVVDMIGGLLTGSVAERLGGTGYVCNAYLGAVPYSMDIVRLFNFSEEICKRIIRSPISGLLLSQKETPEQVQQQKLGQDVENHSNDLASSSITFEETLLPAESENGAPNPDDSAVPLIRACKSVKAGENASQETITYWKENGFSSLIIAAPDLDAWTLVKDLLPLLSNSAPFAIYHQYLEPLATCMHNLQIRKMAIGLQISEPWLREYQVLPCRTHPSMQMSAFGGYILSGTKICSS